MRKVSSFKNENIQTELTNKEGKKLYTAYEILKSKWDEMPITKGTLISMLKEAYKLNFKKAVVFAKKKPEKYEKEALLIYKKKPEYFFVPESEINTCNVLWLMYILRPDEKPPEDAIYSPASECTFGEQMLNLEDPKELAERIPEIVKRLEDKPPYGNLEQIPSAPPSEDYMYFYEPKSFTEMNPTVPLHFIPKQPFRRSFNNDAFKGAVNGVAVEPISPHDPCYYEAICCGNKPSAGARMLIKNYIKMRGVYYFNFKSFGIINPILFQASSNLETTRFRPPRIRQPINTPPLITYPVPRLKVPSYKIAIPSKPTIPARDVPPTSGIRTPLRSQLGIRTPSTMKTIEINKRSFSSLSNIKSTSGEPIRQKRAVNTVFKRNHFVNRNVKPKLEEVSEGAFGLNPTTDITNIVIDPIAPPTGLGTSVERISNFRDENNCLNTYGYYYRNPFAPLPDPWFGNVATTVYADNVFFYPYEMLLPEDVYLDFFVKMSGASVNVSVGASVDFYLALVGQQNTALPIYATNLGVGGQSLHITNSANNHIIELMLRHTLVAPFTGSLTMSLSGFTGAGIPLVVPSVLITPNVNDILRGEPISVSMRIRSQNLGTPLASVLINLKVAVNGRVMNLAPFTIPMGAGNSTNQIRGFAFGYVDYQAAILQKPLLSALIPLASCGAGLTGLQVSTRPIQRKYVWDYTKIALP